MDTLIPRDLPLESGRLLRFTFTVEASLRITENLIGDFFEGDPPSLDALEESFGAGDLRVDSERLLQNVRNYDDDWRVVEHTATLGDLGGDFELVEAPDGIGVVLSRENLRFETAWEADERRRGRQDQWSTRRWLDEVPAPSAEASAPTENS